MGRRSTWIQASIATALVALVAGRWLVVTTAKALWSDTLGVGAVHGEIQRVQSMLLATAFVVAALWCMGNLYLVYRSIGSVHVPRRLGNIEIVEAVPRRYLALAAALLGLLLAFALSHRAGGWWQARALAAVSTRTEISDPLLGRDVAFYLFQLPWQRTLHSFAALLSGVMLAVVALLYAAVGAVRWETRRLHVADVARTQLAGLLAAFGLALFWGYRLEPVEYVAGIHDVPLDTVLTGVRLPVARALAALALVAVGGSLLWLWSRRLVVVTVVWAVLGVVSFVGHYVIPPFAAAVRAPDDLRLAGFDALSDELLSLAYDVGPLEVQIRPVAAVAPSTVARHVADLEAVPVWDGFAVTAYVDRLAGTESHVRFSEASLAAYPVAGGGSVPIYVAARQIDLMGVGNAGTNLSWEQVHVAPYGWGEGALAVLAHRSSDRGFPLFVHDLARPDSAVPEVVELRLARPDVVFAPGAADFIVVPPGDGWLVGAAAGGLFRRLALAWALQSPQLLTSNAVADTSLVVWHRDVIERLEQYAPFARFHGAVTVVANERLYWVANGYVSARAFPVAPPVIWEGRTVHYLRSSLVGVVEASSGSTAVYLTGERDPLTAGWAELVPSLVRPADALPAGLTRHLRYPAELFQVQLGLLSEAVASESDTGGSSGLLRSRARAGEGATHFWWLGTTPADSGRRLRLMAALETGEPPVLAGVADGAMRDGTPVLTFIKVEPSLRVPGPAQLTRRFGDLRMESAGVQGVLRTVPYGDGVLSVQASYMTSGELRAPPRLSDVAVAWGRATAQGATLEQALRRVQLASPSVGVGAAWTEAWRWFQRLDSARQVGDWAAFGRAYEVLRRLLAGTHDSTP